jgi:DNA-binding NarL/FixJ family response regulator
MDRKKSALVVARPGPMLEGLVAMLATMPWLAHVWEAHDVPAALRLIEQHHPGLILLESGLPADDLWAALHAIKGLCPGSYCIVLTEDEGQREEARAAGADDTLSTGLSAVRLFETIDVLRFSDQKEVRL